MQKGLILYMGYYGRYTAAYSIGCLLMLSLYIAGIFLHWAAFGVLLVLTLAGVMLLAVICSVLGTRRFNAAYQRFLTSCDAAAFLAEIRGCQRWQNRSTRPNLALNESFALQALGRGPEALEALSRMGMDRVPRKPPLHWYYPLLHMQQPLDCFPPNRKKQSHLPEAATSQSCRFGGYSGKYACNPHPLY